jgi:hypothetical protein
MSISSELQRAYKKSGLRSIYEKNKNLAQNAAWALGTGGLSIPFSLLDDKKDKKKAELQEIQRNASDNKDKANRGLDDLIGDIRGGTPDAGIPTPVDGPFMPTPIDRDNPPLPGLPPDSIGGIVQTGGQASTDQNRLLAEADLQRQMGIDFAGSQATSRDQMLREYADLISQQQNRILDENTPGLYEDLNTRGLLRSSELGNALGRERGKAASILQEQIGLQGLQDRGVNLSELQGVQNQYQQGRYGAIQRGMSLEDYARQVEAAKLTGQALAPIPQATPSAKGGSALQGGIGGATVGANFGAPGAVIGGLAGLVGGGFLGGY